MKRMLIGATLPAAWVVPAAQACSLKGLTEKAQSFARGYQDLVDRNPQMAQRFAPKAEEAGKAYREAFAFARRGQHFNHICWLYDELFVETDTSGSLGSRVPNTPDPL